MKSRVKPGYLAGCLLLVLFLSATSAAAVTLSLQPSSQTAASGSTVSLELVIAGLGDFAPASLGDFDIDLSYDPAALSFSGITLGGFLGDTALFEAVDYSGGDLGGGLVNLAEVSFLEPEAASCIFCVPPYLDAIQPDTFALATVDFLVDGLASGASTNVAIDTVHALGDGFGIALPLDATADAVIRRQASGTAPEPGSLVLLLAGLSAFAALRHGAKHRPCHHDSLPPGRPG